MTNNLHPARETFKLSISNRFIRTSIALLLVISFILPQGYAQAAPSTCGTTCSKYEVVLIGSEVEGVLLAKAAHDLGLDVLILDPQEKPGGQLILQSQNDTYP